MGTVPSYRAKCAGGKGSVGGKCFQHLRQADTKVPAFANATRVRDYFTEPNNPAGRFPYMRPQGGSGASMCCLSCNPGDGTDVCSGDPTPNLPPCGTWPFDERPGGALGFACAAAPDFSSGYNCYHYTGKTVDLGVCRQRGFKAVQACLYWYGDFGFNSTDRSQVKAGSFSVTSSADPDGVHQDTQLSYLRTCEPLGVGSAPDQTKYLSATADSDGNPGIHGKFTASVGGVVSSYEITRNVSVNKYTGCITLDGTDTLTGSELDTGNGVTMQELLGSWFSALASFKGQADTPESIVSGTPWGGGAGGGASGVNNSGLFPYGPAPSLMQQFADGIYGVIAGYATSSVVTGAGNAWSVVQKIVASGQPDTTCTSSIDLDAGTVSVTYTAGSGATSANITYSLAISATGFAYDLNIAYGNGDSIVAFLYAHLDGTNTFAASDVQNLAEDLAGQWDLTNNTVYPFRSVVPGIGLVDEFCSVAPQVSYRAVTARVGPMTNLPDWDSTMPAFVDPNIAQLGLANAGDAQIAGAPLVAGNLDGHFDFDHITFIVCGSMDGEGDLSCTTEVLGNGALSGAPTQGMAPQDLTDQAVPKAATRWTGNLEAGSYPPGPFALLTGGQFILQKWCQVRTPRPSINFAGPAGADRFAVDATSMAACCGNVPAWADATPADGYYVVLDEELGPQYWKVASGAKTLLGSCPYPSWYDARHDGMYGLTRWPAAWAIAGRVGIASAVASGGNTILTLAGAVPYLFTGDLVDVQTDPLAAPVAAGLAVTVNGDGTVTVPGALSLGGQACYLVSHGAPPWWWFDNAAKGEFARVEWTFDNRSVAITPTLRQAQQTNLGMPQAVAGYVVYQNCLPWDPCNPQVMCYSPNYDAAAPDSIDDFANGLSWNFPALTLDDVCGSQWQAQIVESIDDPLWQAPAGPCQYLQNTQTDALGYAWSEDDGSCPADATGGNGDWYYAHRPKVEARVSVPAPWVTGELASPDFEGRSGVKITALTQAQLATAMPTDGVVFLPPGAVGPTGDGVTCSGEGPFMIQPNLVDSPWGLALIEEGCVCAAGRFAAVYQANLVPCTTPDRYPSAGPIPPAQGPQTSDAGGSTSDAQPLTSD